jgi:hypothetical protein
MAGAVSRARPSVLRSRSQGVARSRPERLKQQRQVWPALDRFSRSDRFEGLHKIRSKTQPIRQRLLHKRRSNTHGNVAERWQGNPDRPLEQMQYSPKGSIRTDGAPGNDRRLSPWVRLGDPFDKRRAALVDGDALTYLPAHVSIERLDGEAEVSAVEAGATKADDRFESSLKVGSRRTGSEARANAHGPR